MSHFKLIQFLKEPADEDNRLRDCQLLPSKEREHAVSPHGLSGQLQADQPK